MKEKLKENYLKLKNMSSLKLNKKIEKKTRNNIKFVQFISIMTKKYYRKVYNKCHLSVEQKKKINEIYRKYYGKKIGFLWHRYYTAFNNVFDEKYIPFNIYLSDIEFYFNPFKEYNKVFENKNIIRMIAKAIDVRTPESLYTGVMGDIFDSKLNLISKKNLQIKLENIGLIFIKPSVDTCGGKNCYLCDFHNGIDSISKKKVHYILNEVGMNFIIQNVIKNHESISKLYSKSLNTFRIVTYRWKKDYFVAPVIMRLGRNGSSVDNASSGGIYIGVNKDGTLMDTAYSENFEKLQIHPDSRIQFKNYRITPIDGVINAALRMHKSLPMLGIVNWDFALDEENNPVLIEANIVNGGGCWLIQIAHGKSLFGERTEEILKWVKRIKKLPIDKRKDFYFGENYNTL